VTTGGPSPVIYVIRHGQTPWNAEHRLQGQADTDINETGRSQADRNGRMLADLIGRGEGFDFVASPMRRTRETMERVRRAMGLPENGYRVDERLKELHFGDWQGHTFAELEQADPGLSQRRDRDKWAFLPPGKGAESYVMLTERIRPWLEGVSTPTICVAHGGIIRAILNLRTGLSARDASMMDVPQDRILRLQGDAAEWL